MNSFCSQCRAELTDEAKFCSHCGHSISGNTEPNLVAIIMMWVLQMIAFIADGANVYVLGLAFGFVSFALAIYLVTRKTYADRANGWLRIGLGIVIGINVYFRLVQR